MFQWQQNQFLQASSQKLFNQEQAAEETRKLSKKEKLMSLGPWEILILVALALLVFGGRGKISQIMGDFGKGLRNFKQNINGMGSYPSEI